MTFADAVYFIALLNPSDRFHELAKDHSLRIAGRILTTDYILLEVADAIASLQDRARFRSFVANLRGAGDVTVVRCSDRLFEHAVDLYCRRQDKEWSLTDCTSFLVMKEHKVIDALTADRHFRQAGFNALMLLERK